MSTKDTGSRPRLRRHLPVAPLVVLMAAQLTLFMLAVVNERWRARRMFSEVAR